MIKKSLQIGMLVVGTVIGAGFASGRELVSFFGNGISIWVAFLVGGAIFVLCALFLKLGSITCAKNVTELNTKLIGRFHFIPDSFLLLNSLIVLSGMLSGMDALGAMFFNAKPLYSLASGLLCIFVISKGLKGLMKCNSVIVPLIIFALILVSCVTIKTQFLNVSIGQFTALSLPITLIYVSMNMMLASTVLTTLGKLTKKEIIGASLVAAVVMTILVSLLILALNSAGKSSSQMPVLEMAKAINPVLFGLIALIIAVSIFTTMLTAMSGLCAWFSTIFGKGFFCPIIVLIAGFIVSCLGFNNVVTLLYPLIGVLGLFYILLSIIFVVRNTALTKPTHTLFNKRDDKVHKRSHHAQNHSRSHN